MARRHIVLSVAVFLVALVLPSSALASSTWTVKNNAGKVVGQVHRLEGSPGYFDVDDATGTITGGLEANGLVMSADGGIHGLAARRSATRAVLHKSSSRTSRIIGKAAVSKHRWVVWKYSAGEWHRRGVVQAGCPGKAAIAALRILLW